MTDTPSVALLGTGIMGTGMARNILAAGLPLTVWNRTADKARPLVDAGARLAEDPADAVRGADVVVTMLGDGAHVLDVMGAAAEGLHAGQVWAQMTTVGVAPLDALVAFAGTHRLVLVDAPVVGTKKPAEDGQLQILGAGPVSARAVLAPVFEAVGSRTVWVGEKAEEAAASRLKLVANSWVLAVTAATGETLALAKGLGVDPQAFLDTIEGGSLDLPYLRMKAGAILTGDMSASFSVANGAKDLDLITEAATASGVRLDLAPAALDRFRRAADQGHAEDDIAAVYYASFDE
ncbi:MAG: NAD(P)-dependent oxidoreductase [Pseudonocardia sp.]|nr:NAD(P)-dependent oxidoreductase [Pseudonocardia sp.]